MHLLVAGSWWRQRFSSRVFVGALEEARIRVGLLRLWQSVLFSDVGPRPAGV